MHEEGGKKLQQAPSQGPSLVNEGYVLVITNLDAVGGGV
jgi:hypothetical protein